MKIFKVIAGFLIIFTIITAFLTLAFWGVGAGSLLAGLIITAKFYGLLLGGAGVVALFSYGCHLISSGLGEDRNEG